MAHPTGCLLVGNNQGLRPRMDQRSVGSPISATFGMCGTDPEESADDRCERKQEGWSVATGSQLAHEVPGHFPR